MNTNYINNITHYVNSITSFTTQPEAARFKQMMTSGQGCQFTMTSAHRRFVAFYCDNRVQMSYKHTKECVSRLRKDTKTNRGNENL